MGKKEVDQEKKILQIESELERNVERIKVLKNKRENILKEIEILKPKVEFASLKKNEIQTQYDQQKDEFEKEFLNKKLPL